MKLRLIGLPLLLGATLILGACAEPEVETPDPTAEETIDEPMTEETPMTDDSGAAAEPMPETTEPEGE